MNNIAAYHTNAANGLTMTETAARLNVTRQSVSCAAGRHGIKFRQDADIRRDTVSAPIPANIHALVSALAEQRGVAFDYVLADLVSIGARGSL